MANKNYKISPLVRKYLNNTGYENWKSKDLEDFYNDDGTNSNLFNNAPRALQCVAIKCTIDTIKSLIASGDLSDDTHKHDYVKFKN